MYVFSLQNACDVLSSLKLFAKEIVFPVALVNDDAKAEISSEVKRFCINIVITPKILEQGALWSNFVESHVGTM